MSQVIYYEKAGIYNIDYQTEILSTRIILDFYKRKGCTDKEALAKIEAKGDELESQIAQLLIKNGNSIKWYFDLSDAEYDKHIKQTYSN